MINKIVTGPSDQDPPDFAGGNHYLSITGNGEIFNICFLVSEGNTLFCFKLNGLLTRIPKGFLDKLEMERSGVFIPIDFPTIVLSESHFNIPDNISAFSRIFWDLKREVKSKQTDWSEIPVYYSEFGSITPSLAFYKSGDFIYVSVGDSVEKALLTSISVARKSLRDIQKKTESFYEKGLSIYKDRKLASNALLAYFYSNSDTIDRNEIKFIASKSPYYYVSAGSWARDLILWNFPCIFNINPSRGRKVLKQAIGTIMVNPGIHALYTDGRILYDGFELDQLAALIHALEIGKKIGIIEDRQILDIMKTILKTLSKWKHPDINLYRTELNSSDDPVSYPYVTYNNALLSSALLRLGKVMGTGGSKFIKEAEAIKEAVFAEMIEEDKFVYSSDLNGRYEMYDDPTGSLLSLPLMGFVERESKIFKNTISWIESTNNPFFVSGKYSGTSNNHVNHPWALYLYWKKMLGERVNLPVLNSGLSCETYDENTGICKTGMHFPGASSLHAESHLENGNKNFQGGFKTILGLTILIPNNQNLENDNEYV